MIDDCYICTICGAVVHDDWAPEHGQFHEDVAAINRDLTEVAKVVKGIVLERACEKPPTLKELGL